MGSGNSVPIWLNPNQTPENYDAWGYIPESMPTPPQHDWSELYQEGFPDTSLFSDSYLKGESSSVVGYGTLWAGQQNDRLTTWGIDLSAYKPVQNKEFHPTKTTFAHPQWNFGQGNYIGKWAPSEDTCDPSNFPNCDMIDFSYSQGDVRNRLAKWWYSEGWSSNKPSAPMIWNKAGPNQDIYTESIERMVEKYGQGKYTGLLDVNSQDTSAYDPCDNNAGFLEAIPPLLGAVSFLMLKSYGGDVLALVPESGSLTVQVTLPLGVYYLSNASLQDPGSDEFFDAMDHCAKAISLGGGVFAGFLANGEFPLENIPAVAYAVVGGLIGFSVNDLVYKALIPAAGVGSILTYIPKVILKFLSDLICKWTTASFSACDDFGTEAGGTEKGFPDARRWDVGSLSARLTDIACEEEGISKNSPQAKFIFRSLVTNPKWFEAATSHKDESIWHQGKPMNPLGLVVAIEEHGHTEFGTKLPAFGKYDKWWQNWTDERYGWTGVESVADPIAADNRYACQSFNLLYQGDECYDSGRPAGPTNDPNADPCAENTSDWNEDSTLASQMKSWLADAVAASRDPLNYQKQFTVPGLSYTYRKIGGVPTYEQYFDTCFQDFDGDTGLGFDNVNQRGEMALAYMNISHPLVPNNTPAEAKMIANSLFHLYPTLEAAWAYIEAGWSEQNQIAYAHYLYADDNDFKWGDTQFTTFQTWENGFTEVKEFKRRHLPRQFGPMTNPMENLGNPKLLKPLGPPENAPTGEVAQGLALVAQGEVQQAATLLKDFPWTDPGQYHFTNVTAAQGAIIGSLFSTAYYNNDWGDYPSVCVTNALSALGLEFKQPSDPDVKNTVAAIMCQFSKAPLSTIWEMIPAAQQQVFVQNFGEPTC